MAGLLRSLTQGRCGSSSWGLSRVLAVFAVDDRIHQLVFAPDGRTLAGTSSSGIATWDLTQAPERANLVGHATDVRSVAIAPDGRTIASGDVAGRLRLWNSSGVHVCELSEGPPVDGLPAVSNLVFSPDGAHAGLEPDRWNDPGLGCRDQASQGQYCLSLQGCRRCAGRCRHRARIHKRRPLSGGDCAGAARSARGTQQRGAKFGSTIRGASRSRSHWDPAAQRSRPCTGRARS